VAPLRVTPRRPKLRLIVLHSNRQHPLEFAKKTRARFTEAFGEDVELHYAESPMVYTPKGETAETFFRRGYQVLRLAPSFCVCLPPSLPPTHARRPLGRRLQASAAVARGGTPVMTHPRWCTRASRTHSGRKRAHAVQVSPFRNLLGPSIGMWTRSSRTTARSTV
jgi:hypothetical protein